MPAGAEDIQEGRNPLVTGRLMCYMYDYTVGFLLKVASHGPMYWAVRTTLCSALRSAAEQLPYQVGDATGQDALDGAAVEAFGDLGTHAKYFQSVVPSSRLSWYVWTMSVRWGCGHQGT